MLVAPSVVALVGGVVAAATTTTEVVDRVVGEPLPSGVVVAASLALLVAILVAGLLVDRRMKAQDRPR